MRIHTENALRFLQLLGTAVDKDPSSLEHWRCLHIRHNEDVSEEWVGETLERLRNNHKDIDCEVIYCLDKDILFISRHLQVDDLYEIADDFIRVNDHAQDGKGEIALYDMCHDWRIMKDLLLNKSTLYVTPEPSTVLYNFGDIASLQEVFVEAKKRRNARMPLHVMVVEDDLLTRRIVANAFKDNYALITAGNAEEAVANYLLHAPDIVFLDIDLPDASGFDVLHQIMLTDADAYVVMFSGNSYIDNVAMALTHGAAGFVSKPFKQDKMRHYILGSAAHHRKQSA